MLGLRYLPEYRLMILLHLLLIRDMLLSLLCPCVLKLLSHLLLIQCQLLPAKLFVLILCCLPILSPHLMLLLQPLLLKFISLNGRPLSLHLRSVEFLICLKSFVPDALVVLLLRPLLVFLQPRLHIFLKSLLFTLYLLLLHLQSLLLSLSRFIKLG